MIGGYRAELDAARTRLAASPATVVETAAGPIEYLDVGHGPPVLWVHGVVGGCDQAPRMSQLYLGDGFRIIAVSRFGYLHSRLPGGLRRRGHADAELAALASDILGMGSRTAADRLCACAVARWLRAGLVGCWLVPKNWVEGP